MDAHQNEYLAAACGLHEQTPCRRAIDCHPVNGHVAYRLKGWSDSSYDDGRIIGRHDGKLLVETASDIVEVDPREWPIGNVLPW